MPTAIKSTDLVIHILNVGFGDNIVIEFPADESGLRTHALVDCRSAAKTREYLARLRQIRPAQSRLAFVCATHPHMDHVAGIESIINDPALAPAEFWDSGFRHNSQTYERILEALLTRRIRMVRVAAGMEWYFGKVQVTVLAPAVALRNRYDTYGVDMNNASVVLRIEHHAEETVLMRSREYIGAAGVEAQRTAGRSVVILAGDAEYDSWSHITQDFPRVERTSNNNPLVTKMINYLACSVVKVAHHGSMHSSPLDVYEKMLPEVAILSGEQEVSTKRVGSRDITRTMFPHTSATVALEESGARVVSTDGWYESQEVGGVMRDPEWAHPGSLVIVVPPGGRPRIAKLDDGPADIPQPPQAV